MDHDLHSLLAAARDDAPPPRLSIDDITAAGRQLARRRRRTVLLSSVAGGVAAVITGATAAIVLFAPPAIAPSVDPNGNPGLADVSQSPARRADLAPAGPFETSYAGYQSGRFLVSDPDLVTAGYQQSSIDVRPTTLASPSVQPTAIDSAPSASAGSAAPPGRGDLTARQGRLVVYGAGAFDEREFTKGEKLTIDGRVALLRHAGGLALPATTDASKLTCCQAPIVPTLAWQYQPDAWAAIYWNSFETAPSRDELVALAEDLPAEDPRPFPVGIQMRNIPKGYKLLAVSTRRSMYDDTNLSVVRLGLKPLAGPFTAPVELDEFPSILLILGVTDERTREKIGKTSCLPGSNSCAALIADGPFFMQVESVGDRPFDASQLSQILKSMSAAEPENPSSWPPASSIFTS